MEAVYEWIRQISVFAVLSFLVLYLMGNQEKKSVLRFYLSLLMLLLVLRPAASLFNLNQVLTEKLTKLETETEVSAAGKKVRQAAAISGRELLDYTSRKALSWIEGLIQYENMSLQEGDVVFDEEKLEQTGEVAISGIRITVSPGDSSPAEMQPMLKKLESEIAEAFDLNQSAVTVKAGAQDNEY